jgi:hypothetical protein
MDFNHEAAGRSFEADPKHVRCRVIPPNPESQYEAQKARDRDAHRFKILATKA